MIFLRIIRTLFFVSPIFLMGNAKSFEWPDEECGEFKSIDESGVDIKIIYAVNDRNKLSDVKYEISKQQCLDGSYFSFKAVGRYHNPGFNWLVVVQKNGEFKIIDGM